MCVCLCVWVCMSVCVCMCVCVHCQVCVYLRVYFVQEHTDIFRHWLAARALHSQPESPSAVFAYSRENNLYYTLFKQWTIIDDIFLVSYPKPGKGKYSKWWVPPRSKRIRTPAGTGWLHVHHTLSDVFSKSTFVVHIMSFPRSKGILIPAGIGIPHVHHTLFQEYICCAHNVFPQI